MIYHCRSPIGCCYKYPLQNKPFSFEQNSIYLGLKDFSIFRIYLIGQECNMINEVIDKLRKKMNVCKRHSMFYLSELACYIDEVIDLIKIHVCFCYDIIKDSIRFQFFQFQYQYSPHITPAVFSGLQSSALANLQLRRSVSFPLHHIFIRKVGPTPSPNSDSCTAIP